jgi:hypothetical protein
LHNFKALCQQTAINSLEKVVAYFISRSENEVKIALQAVDPNNMDFEDLDAVESPDL